MTAGHIQRFAAYAVKLLPAVAFAFVYQVYVVQYHTVACLAYVPSPVCLCCLLDVPILLKVRAFDKEMKVRVNTIYACLNEYQPL